MKPFLELSNGRYHAGAVSLLVFITVWPWKQVKTGTLLDTGHHRTGVSLF